jgi:CO dehydrogenase nickel-insertion accessory protein CooC1
MAKELGIKNVLAIANKITEPAEIDIIKSQLKDIVLLGSLSYSKSVQQSDLNRAPVIKADNQFIEELRKTKKQLENLVFLKV